MAWLYTEIEEYGERHAIYIEFKRFQEVGKRFTAEDGLVLKERIAALEVEIDELTGD
jgi:deoxyadenosine/deoxycytidine kinase